MKVGSLFSGIGGLDLGLERAGMTVAWQSEIDLYACKVLAKHWPGVPNHGDIKQIDWRTVEPVDVICGGYPCQPFSKAGRRQGTEDPRHLWPWVRDAISAVRPRYAILENVREHLSLGFSEVIGELAALGYDCRWDCIPAAAVGAPHLRDRVFIIARQQRPKYSRALANSNHTRSRDPLCTGWDAPWDGGSIGWQHWQVEPDVGRVADGVPHRVDRLRGLGNAVVPQVAEYVGRLVMAHANT
jgi:DNA (cytosine-5)-methyltransferase 1